MTTWLDTTKRQLFELRFDMLAPGRAIADLRAWHLDSAPGRAAAGVPAPEGVWTVRLGSRGPGLVTLTRWPSLTDRQATLGAWLDTPAARGQVWDGARGLIRDAESWILIDSPAGAGRVGPATVAGGLHEMRLYRALNGSVAEAAEALADHDLAAAQAAGAQPTGLYEIAIGPERPLIAATFAWPPGVLPADVWLALDARADTGARRLAERARHRRRLIGLVEPILLQPVEAP